MFVSPSPPSRPAGSLKLPARAPGTPAVTCNRPPRPAPLVFLPHSTVYETQVRGSSRLVCRGTVIEANTETTKLRAGALRSEETIMWGGVGTG